MIIFLISAIGAGLFAANVVPVFAWMRHSGGAMAQMEVWINHQAYHVSIWLHGVGFGPHTTHLMLEGLIGLAVFVPTMVILKLLKRIFRKLFIEILHTTSGPPAEDLSDEKDAEKAIREEVRRDMQAAKAKNDAKKTAGGKKSMPIDSEKAIRKQAKRDIRAAVNWSRRHGIERADVIYREKIAPILRAEVKKIDWLKSLYSGNKENQWREIILRNAWKPILGDYRTKLGISREQVNEELAKIRRRIATERGIVITPDRDI